MKTTKTKNCLIVAIAVFAVAMMVTPLQNADAFLPKSASSEYITWGDGAKSFVKSSIFDVPGNDLGFRSFSSGVSLVDYVGDEDEDINVSYAGGEDTTDKQDLLVQPVFAIQDDKGDKQDLLVTSVSSVDDVHAKCDVWSFWIPMPQSCIKDGMRSTELPCESFGRVC